MNRIDRLMGMLLFLQGRRVTRAEDLSKHFEISVRTVYRDLAALGEAGVPLLAEAGVGYSLMRGYHVPPVMFTAEEAGALATAGVLTRQLTDDSVAESMESALLKIRAVLPVDQQNRLERIEKGTRLSANARTEAHVSIVELQKALSDRNVIHLVYRSGGKDEVTRRDVEPIGLVHYLAHWHLIAWCRIRNDVRDFRIDRIAESKVSGERFEPRPGVTLQSVVEEVHCGETLRGKVRFNRRSVDKARREWSTGIEDEEPDGDGTILTLRTGSFDWLVGWLLSFQTEAKVLEPTELREKVRSAALKIADSL